MSLYIERTDCLLDVGRTIAELLPNLLDKDDYGGDPIEVDFAAGYINYLPVNGAVIAPQFGDAAADGYCRDLLTRLYPARKVEQLDIDPIAAGGGGIHCVTKQLPRA